MNVVYQERRSGHAPWKIMALVIVSIVALPENTLAQKWQIAPTVRVGAEYDDNARLDTRTDLEVELEGWLAELEARLLYASQRTEFEATPRVMFRRYSDNPEFDSEDIFFTSRYLFKSRQNNFGFGLTYDEQQVRTAERSDAELDVEDPDEIPDDSTGSVGAGGDRTKWRFTPYWERRLSESSFFALNVDYFDVRYSGVTLDRLKDYTDTRIDLSYRRAFSEKSTAIALGSVRSFEREDVTDNEFDGYSAMVGVSRDLSPTTELRALVGFEYTDQGILGTQTEPVADISLRQKLETIRLLAVYRRLVNASGSGQLTVRDSIMLNATRRLNEKISAGVGLRAYQSENLSDLTREDREFIQLRARFSWNFTRTLSMSVDYRYSVLDRGNLDGESANSNQVMLWFAYEQIPST